MPGVDYRTAAGRTMTGLMAIMADAQYQTAKARGDAIADAVLARGVPNRVPYGYRRNADQVTGVKTDPTRDGKALVPDEATAPIVRRIFALRRDGYAWSAIVETLNEAGVPAPSGRLWVTSSLSTIVRNEVYTLALVLLGKRRVEAAHEALVTATAWRRAQSVRPVIRNGNLVAGIAGGLLECSGCGRPLATIGTNHSKPGYDCRRMTSDGPCPRPVYVAKAVCDAFVHDAVRDALGSVDVHLVSSAREIEQARQAVDRARSERKAFARFASALDEEDFRSGYDERRKREAEAAHLYDDLLANAADAEDMPSSPDAYDALDLTHQRRVALSLIERIIVSPPLTRSVRDRVIEDRLALEWKRGG